MTATIHSLTTPRASSLDPLLALVATACGGNGDDEKTSDTTGGNAGKAPAVTAGFDGKTITLGVITPQTGIAAVIGKPLTRGNQTYIDMQGGLGGAMLVEAL